MAAWDEYPADYRETEVKTILAAVRAGECVSVVGLSGAGKSNLIGFLYHRCNTSNPTFALVDGNRARLLAPGPLGLLKMAVQALGQPAQGSAGFKSAENLSAPDQILSVLERAVAERLSRSPGGLCLLLDRYDALSAEEQAAAAGPLRALRDAFKYQLTYVIATRRPLDPNDELAELFYANTLWLGPLSPTNARWSAAQYAARRGQTWDVETISRLVILSGGYPSLLRACCEAYALGAPLDIDALRAHPAIQRRVKEFWADQPAPEDLRRSGLSDSTEIQALLATARPAVSAASPELTASEHRLLAYFQAHPGEVCAKDDLIYAVWPEERVINGMRDDSLAQLIRRLRQKVGVERIQTIPGRGYRYQP